MLELDRSEVLRALPGGVVAVGPAPLVQGDLARVGEHMGVVTAVLEHEARVAMVDGVPDVGDPVAPAGPVGYPAGPFLLGRIVDPLGQPMDGAGSVGSSRHPRVAAPFRRTPLDPTPLPTGVPSVDALAPVARGRSHLLVGASARARTELAMAMAPPLGTRVVALPGAAPGIPESFAAPDAAVVASPSGRPPYGHLLAVEAALTLAAALREQGEHAVLLVVGLDVVARAARELRRALGGARDPWGWPVSLSSRVATLTDHALEGPGGSLTLVVTAGDEEPGLSDHLVPWFDRAARLRTVTRPGHLPEVAPSPG